MHLLQVKSFLNYAQKSALHKLLLSSVNPY